MRGTGLHAWWRHRALISVCHETAQTVEESTVVDGQCQLTVTIKLAMAITKVTSSILMVLLLGREEGRSGTI